jgi:hypothetical protein
MGYRLLVDLEVLLTLERLPRKIRTQLLDHFEKLRVFPDDLSDDNERDRTGRRIEISVIAGYAVHYWIDFADRHVKVLLLRQVPD